MEISSLFIILVHYKVSIETIDQYLDAHRNFLDEGYQKNYFVASGPKIPRTGGVIISQLNNREQLDAILNDDPFKIHNLADYEILEFTPIKYHQQFKCFISES